MSHRSLTFVAVFSQVILHGAQKAEPLRGTPVEARLATPISSYSAKAGDAIEAALVSPVCFGADSAVPEGATLQGTVLHVHRVGLGLAHETARLELNFDQIRLLDGEIYTIQSRLAAVENARERVDQTGAIHGIRATDSLSSRFASRLLFAARAHPVAMGPSFALETLLFHFPDPEIEYGAGTELRLLVQFPSFLGDASPCAEPESLLADQTELDGLASTLPEWSYSKRQPQPMDPVNLVFVGAQEDLEQAFALAGWTESAANSLASGFHAIQAVAEEREYTEAPMRTLLLDGAEPDLRLQRTLNTFDKRDHMRIWKRGEWQGRALWAAAATRDVGTTFSLMHPFGFTHRIEKNVDLERDSVVTDLKFTGCVESAAYASRPEDPAASGQPSRKGIRTDGRVAILFLTPCEAEPQREETAPLPTPSIETRLIRRITLTARNHYIRDNIIWRTGDAIRLGWHALREWESDRKADRTAQALAAGQ
jgi:hypothetical protein